MNYLDLERAHLTWQILKGILLVWGLFVRSLRMVGGGGSNERVRICCLVHGEVGGRIRKTDPEDEHYVSIYQRIVV